MNSLYRIIGYFLGYMTIASVVPHPISLKNWCIITLAGLIFIATTTIFREK